MAGVILQTKLNIPPLRLSLVERHRLIDKLNQGLYAEGEPGTNRPFSRKLTLVSAPAGFGKSTLVSTWLGQLAVPAAWLSLDESDNEPNHFFFYLTTTLQKINNNVGQSALSLLQSPQPPPINTLLALLINDLVKMGERIVLALDDYHVIHLLDIHKGISFLLDNQPPQLHLVIMSREDPALPLHRLRASGQMRGIHVRDLRFSSAEATTFLTKTMGLSLTTEEISILARRTEGWVAGLQLAALSMQDMNVPGEFVTFFAGDDRYISDYLIGEVFERQPAPVKDFLLRTSILDRFNAPLCDALLATGDRGSAAGEQDAAWPSQAAIDRLDQLNLFIIPLDNKRDWYRFHHLFLDFLRMRLRDRPVGEVADLHRRAAAWFEKHGLLAQAIDHALAGKEFRQAGRLIEQNAMFTIFGHAQWNTLFKWMAVLPIDLIRSRPRLSIQYIWALFATGRWEAAKNFLEEVEPAIEAASMSATTEPLLGEFATIGGLVAYSQGDIERSARRAHRALSSLPEDNLTLRCVALLVAGESATVQDDASRARSFLHQAIDVALAADNRTIALFALGDLARLALTEGRLHQVTELYQKARSLGSIEGKTTLGPAGITFIQMGEVLREWDRPHEARPLLLEGITLCRQLTGLPNIVLEGQISLARTMLTGGDEQEASKTMQEAESILAELFGKGGDIRPILTTALAYRLQFWLASGKRDEAAHWLEENGIIVESAIAPGDVMYHLILARILIEGGHLEKTRRQLKKLEQIVAARKAPRLEVELLILQAELRLKEDKRDLAIETLTRALCLSESEGFIHLFVNVGPSITPLLEGVAGHPPAPSVTRVILNHLKGGQVAVGAQSAETFLLVEPLKDQEIRILRLLAAGLSNREIAAELFLSINTIKTYTSRIYGKLSVHGRAEAVNRAHELGLF